MSVMNFRQEKRSLQNKIDAIEKAIGRSQYVIDTEDVGEYETKRIQGYIEKLTVELETYRYYLCYLK